MDASTKLVKPLKVRIHKKKVTVAIGIFANFANFDMFTNFANIGNFTNFDMFANFTNFANFDIFANFDNFANFVNVHCSYR